MGKILEINGPLVKLDLPQTVLGEQVRVGRLGLVGEVICRDGNTALALLYEDTAGLCPGEEAEGLGWPLSVELGPGLLGGIFDGVQRPLQAMWEQRGDAVAPLITGQRILDTFYPLLKGGKAAIPGPFGAGKTMLQHQVARWCNAQIVIYVGCGERGNELTDVLESMPTLTDPHTGRPLMERTLLVANTSNMPEETHEASIYVGITLAEYFRVQGYDVVMVDYSTIRWAEALSEVD